MQSTLRQAVKNIGGIAWTAKPKIHGLPVQPSMSVRVAGMASATASSPTWFRCAFIALMDWLMPRVWKKQAQADARTVFSSSLTAAVINAAGEGMGVILLPCYLGDTEQRLVRVSDTVESLTLELWVLTHPDLRHTARVKALRAYLYDALKKDADLFEGKRGEANDEG